MTVLNEAEVPPDDVVGNPFTTSIINIMGNLFFFFFEYFVAEVVVSPPFVFLPLVKNLLRSDFEVAAQNCWVRKGGAFTGEIRYLLYFVFCVCVDSWTVTTTCAFSITVLLCFYANLISLQAFPKPTFSA